MWNLWVVVLLLTRGKNPKPAKTKGPSPEREIPWEKTLLLKFPWAYQKTSRTAFCGKWSYLFLETDGDVKLEQIKREKKRLTNISFSLESTAGLDSSVAYKYTHPKLNTESSVVAMAECSWGVSQMRSFDSLPNSRVASSSLRPRDSLNLWQLDTVIEEPYGSWEKPSQASAFPCPGIPFAEWEGVLVPQGFLPSPV